MKKVISLVLVLIIVFSICFQCSFTSSAIIGVDDAILITGVCLDLLALGITIHSVSDFVQSDTFNDFCRSLGDDIDNGISTMKRNGKLFIATTKLAWQDLCNWVKSKFSGLNQTKRIEYDITTPSTPSSITLANGISVPYGDWMSNPFLIYQLPNGDIYGWYCSGENPGVNPTNSYLRMWCTGGGKCYKYTLTNGAWSEPTEYSMRYGLTYKGVTGSFYDINRPSGVSGYMSQMIQYRTIDRVADNGTAQEEAPPNTVPEVDVNTSAYVTASSDAAYYPGAVDAPAEVIQQGELVLIEVPEQLVVDPDAAIPTITTDTAAIGNAVGQLNPSDVRPKVLTQSGSVSGTVDQVIDDTPVAELDGTNAGTAADDIEIANKFRLPKSFLEGFPFSIPYSIYVGIQSFVAEPQAPYFEFPFSIPGLGIDDHMVVDLSQWNAVARLCRALLSLVWVAGLAMVCHRFIKR